MYIIYLFFVGSLWCFSDNPGLRLVTNTAITILYIIGKFLTSCDNRIIQEETSMYTLHHTQTLGQPHQHVFTKTNSHIQIHQYKLLKQTQHRKLCITDSTTQNHQFKKNPLQQNLLCSNWPAQTIQTHQHKIALINTNHTHKSQRYKLSSTNFTAQILSHKLYNSNSITQTRQPKLNNTQSLSQTLSELDNIRFCNTNSATQTHQYKMALTTTNQRRPLNDCYNDFFSTMTDQYSTLKIKYEVSLSRT